MPLTFNDSTDDPPVFDVCESFAGGQASFTRENRLAPNQAEELLNCDISRDGLLTTRRGSSLIGSAAIVAATRIQGLAYFDTPSLEYLVAAIDGDLYRWNGTTWAVVAGYSAADSVRDVNFAQGIDKLYLTDGSANVHSWDGTTVVNLGTGAASQPPVCKYLAWHTNRLFAAGVPTIPDAVYVSNILTPATWDTTTQQFRVGAGDGDPITGISPWIDHDLIVLKRSSLWVVNANPAEPVANWAINNIHRRIGCVSGRSVCQVGQDVWFLSDSGVRSVRRTLATDQNEISEAISYPVQDIIERINWDHAHKCAAAFWNNRYLISLPLDSATDPDYVLVYNTLTKAWSGLWTGWSPLAFAASSFSGALRLNFGTPAGTVLKWLDYVRLADEVDASFQDNGTEIATRVRTRALSFAELACKKKGYTLETEFSNSVAECDVALVFDQDEPVTLEADVITSSGTPVFLPVNLPFFLPGSGTKRRKWPLLNHPSFRELQVEIEAEAGKLSLRQILGSAFVETMEVEE